MATILLGRLEIGFGEPVLRKFLDAGDVNISVVQVFVHRRHFLLDKCSVRANGVPRQRGNTRLWNERDDVLKNVLLVCVSSCCGDFVFVHFVHGRNRQLQQGAL